MALLFMDGFDVYEDLDDVFKSNWTRTNVTDITFSTTAGRYGGGCIEGVSDDEAFFRSMDVVQGDTVIVAWAYFWTAGAAAVDVLLRGMVASGTQLFALDHDINSGDLRALNTAGAQVGSTASAALTPDAWNFIEVKVTLGTNDTTGSIDVRVGGSLVISVSGIDTFTATGLAGRLARMSFYGADTSYKLDDIVIMDGSGSTMNDFIGDCRIELVTPISDGGVVDWAAASGADFTNIDDPPNATDGDGGYIQSKTAGEESRFNMSNLAVVPDDIWTVQVRARVRKTDAGARTFRGLVNSNGSEDVGPTRGISTTYNWDWLGNFDVDPDTGLQWDQAGVNAMQIGVEVVA